MLKATFTFDDTTFRALRETAERLGRPRSEVVREAICEYAERVGRLGEAERKRLLEAFDALVPAIPPRTAAETDRELDAIRSARRQGGRGGRRGGDRDRDRAGGRDGNKAAE